MIVILDVTDPELTTQRLFEMAYDLVARSRRRPTEPPLQFYRQAGEALGSKRPRGII